MIRTITFDDALWQVVPKDRSYETRAKQIIAFNTESGDLDDKLEAAHQELLAAAPQPQEHSSPCGNDEEHSFWVDSQDWPCPICAAKKQPQEQSEPVARVTEANPRCWDGFIIGKVPPGTLLYTAPLDLAAKVAELEELNARLCRELNDQNGPTFMGEPAIDHETVPVKMYDSAVKGRAAFRKTVMEQRTRITELESTITAQDAKVAELEAEKNETIRISKKHIARCDVRAAEQEARITELESTIAAQADQIRGAREAIELAHQQLQRVAEFNWPDARRTKLNHSIFVCEEALAKIGGA